MSKKYPMHDRPEDMLERYLQRKKNPPTPCYHITVNYFEEDFRICAIAVSYGTLKTIERYSENCHSVYASEFKIAISGNVATGDEFRDKIVQAFRDGKFKRYNFDD